MSKIHLTILGVLLAATLGAVVAGANAPRIVQVAVKFLF